MAEVSVFLVEEFSIATSSTLKDKLGRFVGTNANLPKRNKDVKDPKDHHIWNWQYKKKKEKTY